MMRKVILGALVAVGLLVAGIGAFVPAREALAQRSVMAAHESVGEAGMIAVAGPSSDTGQWISVVDPKSRAIAVYRIDGATGRIKLAAVRNIHWDLQVMQLNSESPLPQEIRSMLDQR